MRKKAMAAEFTPVTFDEILKYLNGAFAILRPKEGPVLYGERTINLTLSAGVGVRVFTSVHTNSSGAGADVGADAIRVGLIALKTGRPMKTGKMPIVKRTQNWRDNLRERIEDEIECYDDRTGYWESRTSSYEYAR